MKKKNWQKVGGLALAALLTGSMFAGCGGSSDEVVFWYTGSDQQQELYAKLADKFNETYGAANGVKIKAQLRPVSSYESNIQITAGSTSGPDIYLVRNDDVIKTWIIGHYMADITEEFNAITDLDLGDLSSSAFMNARYNVEKNTSYESDPLYGVPVDPQTTAIFYNYSLFEKAGIICISVDEADLAKWSAGEIVDKNGLSINDPACAKLKTLLNGGKMPAKGYFRSENPYYYNGSKTKKWETPTNDEVLVFNDRVPMNWDETEDLAMLFTGSYNPAQGEESKGEAARTKYNTTYGFFQEWWFNYGWSVGGDCLVDLSGNGDWSMGLLDPNPNYVVQEGKTFTSRTGVTYQAGEIVSFWDKMNIEGNEILSPEDYGDFYKAGTETKAGIHSSVTAAKEAGTLGELPSMRTAFNRYLKLGAKKTAQLENGESGIKVSPSPLAINQRGLVSYFLSQELAFCTTLSSMVPDLAARAPEFGFEFGIAPLSIYKEYEDPSDPFCEDTVVEGVQAGHVNNVTMAVREGSSKKAEAVKFLKWTTSLEGQAVRASMGLYPMQASLMDQMKTAEGQNVRNLRVFAEAASYSRPGDWWYMPDCTWVQRWCTDLNASLRNGEMTYQEWLDGAGSKASAGGKVVVRTNEWIASYNISR